MTIHVVKAGETVGSIAEFYGVAPARLASDNGVPATAHREERDGYIEYTVRIPTAAAQR